MELPPISASLGAMGSLVGKLDLDLLLDAELKVELRKLTNGLVLLSESRDRPVEATIWVKDVRELSYDMENCIDLAEPDWVGRMSGFKARVKEGNERYDRFMLGSIPICSNAATDSHIPMVDGPRRRPPDLPLVGLHDGPFDALYRWLTDDDKELKVASVVGVGGIGKTTVAKQLWHEHKPGGYFASRAFVRTAKKPDMRRFLRSMLAQVRPHQPPDTNEVHELIHDIRQHLQGKRSGPAELRIKGKGDLHILDQVLVSNKETGLEKLTLERCPPLELKHLLMLTTLKTLIVKYSDDMIGSLGGQVDVEWQLPVWFPKLQELEISKCPEFSSLIPISWIESLRHVTMKHVKLLKEFKYSKSSYGVELEIKGKCDLHSLDQVLVFDKETCLEKLTLERLSYRQQTTSETSEMEEDEIIAPEEQDDDGVRLFPAHLFDSQGDALTFPLLQVLIIIGWPKLLGLSFSNHIVFSYWFPKLQELQIRNCPEFLSVIPTSWIESLHHVTIEGVKLLEEFKYSKSSDGVELEISGKDDLHSLDQVLVFDKETCLEKLTLLRCPPLELKHLLMLTSLKTLIVDDSDCLVGSLGGQGDVEWQLPVEHVCINDLNCNSGKELTELLPHLPKLSKLEISDCESIKQLVVGVDLQQTTSSASEMVQHEITTAEEEEDDGVLLFPANLFDSLRELEFDDCPELVLVDPRGWLQALQTLQRLRIVGCPGFLSRLEIVPCRHIFPSSLQFLELMHVKGMRTLEPLSNLSCLVTLELWNCGEDLTCRGLWSLITSGGQLKELRVSLSPRFFAGWDLEDVEGEEQQTQLVSPTLCEICTDDLERFLAAPICSFLSSSLTKLKLLGDGLEEMGRFFSKEQEDALQLFSSLQELQFWRCHNLQKLPAGLHNLTSLKKLTIYGCRAVSSLPDDGLPKSLQELWVNFCGNKELKQQCRGLVDTIPKIEID